MRIGILTQPLRHNYGGTLQNYALQQLLKRLGHEPITINWGISKSWHKWAYHALMALLRGKKIPGTPLKETIIDINFHKFHNSYIVTTKSMGKVNPLQIMKEVIDFFIVGSDQVWRADYNSNLEYMFFSFLPDDAKRMSYAASLGSENWTYSHDLTQKCKEYLKKFQCVTVREESSVTLFKENVDIYAKLVLDPTLLLDIDEYERNLNLKKNNKSMFIAVYLLDKDIKKIDFINRISSELNLAIKYIGDCDDNHNRYNGKYQAIENWLEDIRDARYLITDSFHGTAFAINFHTAFVTLGNANRGNTRFDSILNMFGLNSKLISLDKTLPSIIDEISKPIDWDTIDKKKNIMKAKSIDYIAKAIG